MYYDNKYSDLDEVFVSGYFIRLFFLQQLHMYYMLDLSKHFSQPKYFALKWLVKQYGFGYLRSADGA